jgi:maleylpyruvate isomerase
LLAARAGQVGRQYPSEQARAEAIDTGARRPAPVIRADLDRAVQECVTAIREHPCELWDAPGIWLGLGRRPVRGVVRGLWRELEYHHVDLATGYPPASWPNKFVSTELTVVATFMNDRADAPPMTLTSPSTLHIETSPPTEVTGPSAALLAWLAGRNDGRDLQVAGSGLPDIPPFG